MARRLLSSLIVPFVVSCAVSAAEDERPHAAVIAAAEPLDLGEIDDPALIAPVPLAAAAEPSADVVPAGSFPTLEALCDAQEALIVPTLRRAEEELRDLDPDRTIAPHCARSAHAFDGVSIELHAPFIEVAPLEIETGFAIEIHLAVRTAEGWTALPHASIASFYNDPGCFSIERDDGLVAVTVKGEEPTLELVERSVRGASMDVSEDDDGNVSVSAWADVTRRSVVCSVASGKVACHAPTILSVERMKS